MSLENTEEFYKELNNEFINYSKLLEIARKGIYLNEPLTNKYSHAFMIDISILANQHFTVNNDNQYYRLKYFIIHVSNIANWVQLHHNKKPKIKDRKEIFYFFPSHNNNYCNICSTVLSNYITKDTITLPKINSLLIINEFFLKKLSNEKPMNNIYLYTDVFHHNLSYYCPSDNETFYDYLIRYNYISIDTKVLLTEKFDYTENFINNKIINPFRILFDITYSDNKRNLNEIEKNYLLNNNIFYKYFEQIKDINILNKISKLFKENNLQFHGSVDDDVSYNLKNIHRVPPHFPLSILEKYTNIFYKPNKTKFKFTKRCHAIAKNWNQDMAKTFENFINITFTDAGIQFLKDCEGHIVKKLINEINKTDGFTNDYEIAYLYNRCFLNRL
ncbi:hypothetical protein BCR32DRAFT_291337 [Anaeromyces robustus]|uniref:Uncharacterized protein n=1 Tax=Anaeromyces robustus TaxID=1754192 RepID=A0A1Y1XFB9_9FUNG|nr:hypothetical protein BCR32DRAFT_291337 [Anaeromyces robustus]|eukprot:ORX84448.1 hypothetical protein BCR32DRAFT_291337 [Anaeromyces robustus]